MHERVNPFLAKVPILYHLKTPHTFGFLAFLGGIKWGHWPDMGKVEAEVEVLE